MPAITSDQNDVRPPKLSEICGVLILPMGAAPPTSWTDASAIEDTSDNTVTDNSKTKWIVGRGELPDPEEVIISMGRDERRIGRRLYALEFEVNVRCDPELSFVRTFQRSYRSFRFWLATRGGRFLGGSRGIFPKFVTASAPYLRDDLERAFLRFEWFADGSPSRATVSNLFTGQSGTPDTPTPVENVMYYAQSFVGASSRTLTWVENNGTLPSSNTQAQILVFQNGQKLEETVQYTLSHNTGPSESQIIINALTHFSGANYEAIVVSTS